MKAHMRLILSGLVSLAALAGGAAGQTANFDAYPEGAIGRDFTDGGIRFFNYNNRLDPPPSMLVAERAIDNLTGQPNFTAPNALGFGGYSPGNGAAFTRFGSMEIEPAAGTATSATINVYDFGNGGGVTLKLEASLEGIVVATDTVTLPGGWFINHSMLTIESEEFDHLLLRAGPSPSDVVFMLIDTVTLAFEGRLTLDPPSPGLAGVNNTLSAHGATPGERVYFVYGLRSGSTNIPGCPGVVLGMAAPAILGSNVANGVGEAELTFFVPNAAHNRRVFFQAVERSSCEVSNLVEFVFP